MKNTDVTRTARTRRTVGAVAACYALALWVAPAAHAGPIGDVTTTVSDTVGTATGAVDAVTQPSSGSGSTGGGGGSLAGAVEQAAGTVTDTTDSATGPVEEAVKETVNTVTDTLDKSTGGATAPVTQATKDTVNSVGQLGGSVTDRASGTVGGLLEGSGKGDRAGRQNDDGRNRAPRSADRNGSDVLGRRTEQGSQARTSKVTLASDARSTSPTTAPGESIVQQIGRVAAEAAKQMAFPLLLTLLVIGFLTMQSRMDRKDPKLALAPVDSEHDLLSFS